MQPLYSFGINDLVFIILIFACGFMRINYMVKKFDLHSERSTITGLFYFHMVFGMVYMLYVTILGGDAKGYWTIGLEQIQIIDASWWDYYGLNTTFILFVVYPFSKVLGLGFQTGSLMFSFFGFMGFSYIYLMMTPYKKFMTFRGIKLFPLILFLPNLHFWSSGVGKDALIFMGIAMFIFSSRNIYKNLYLAVFSFVLIYHIRPHMAILLGASFLIAVLLGGNLKPGQRFIGIAAGIVGMVLIYPKVTEFLLLDELSVGSIQNFATAQASVLSRSTVGSAVDITSYSFPMKIFTYLFRPLFFDAHNLFALIISFENLVYLLMSLFLLSRRSIRVFRVAPSYVKMGLIAFIGGTLAFSISLGNLGIAMRMKNMTMVYMLMFACMIVGYSNYLKRPKNQLSDESIG